MSAAAAGRAAAAGEAAAAAPPEAAAAAAAEAAAGSDSEDEYLELPEAVHSMAVPDFNPELVPQLRKHFDTRWVRQGGREAGCVSRPSRAARMQPSHYQPPPSLHLAGWAPR